jgi:hypothetical protein
VYGGEAVPEFADIRFDRTIRKIGMNTAFLIIALLYIGFPI